VLLAPFVAKARPCVAADRVGAALAWAEARCEEPPSVGELAAVAGMHPTSFAKSFRRRTGLPPATWLRQHRLTRARALIGGGATLAQAAARCGFCDAFHLSRLLNRPAPAPRLRGVR
jgi:transcriptional regulator GlxA family with amidase domain